MTGAVTPILEKAALAVEQAIDEPDTTQRFAEQIVRAVLLAIRGPDEAMTKAMCVAIEDTPLNDDPVVDGYDIWIAPVRAAQAAMIDTILGEKPA